MSRVTAPSLSANNWQTWFSVYLLVYLSVITHNYMRCPQCKTSRPTTKATRTRGLTLSGTMEYLEWSALSKCWNVQLIFNFSHWQTLFLSVIFVLQLKLGYYRFLWLVEKIYKVVFSWKKLTRLLVFSLPTFIICKKKYILRVMKHAF